MDAKQVKVQFAKISPGLRSKAKESTKNEPPSEITRRFWRNFWLSFRMAWIAMGLLLLQIWAGQRKGPKKIGLTAVMFILSTGRNLGQTLQLTWQGFVGIALPLCINVALYPLFHLVLKDNIFKIVLRLVYLFVSSIFWCASPASHYTKKVALATTVSSVMWSDLSIWPDDKFFISYLFHGVGGLALSIAAMTIPTPLLASRYAQRELLTVYDQTIDLFNAIMDTYYFHHNTPEGNDYITLKFRRSFIAAESRLSTLSKLIQNSWWEYFLWAQVHPLEMEHHTALLSRILVELQTLHTALQQENYNHTQDDTVYQLQPQALKLQTSITELLRVISSRLNNKRAAMPEKIVSIREDAKCMIQTYGEIEAKTKTRMDRAMVQQCMVMDVFFFTLFSIGDTLVPAEKQLRNINRTTTGSGIFFRRLRSAYENYWHSDNGRKWMVYVKVALALTVTSVLAVVFKFSEAGPVAIAFVVGTQKGASFADTIDRVAGVTMGSVIPSLIFALPENLLQLSTVQYILLTGAQSCILFVWTLLPMYFCFEGGRHAYAGKVAAFIAAGIMLDPRPWQNETMLRTTNILTETSLSLLLFVVIEFGICPLSAVSLMQKNYQNTLTDFNEYAQLLLVSKENYAEKLEPLQQIQARILAQMSSQDLLFREACAEPQLWRQLFSQHTYHSLSWNLQCIFNNLGMLQNVIQWYEGYRESGTQEFPGHESLTSHSQVLFRAFKESFNVLVKVFDSELLFADPGVKAKFMQMRDAFRLADVDGDGVVTIDEMVSMLSNSFPAGHTPDQGKIRACVSQIMEIIDTDKSKTIDFSEFEQAFQSGLCLEVYSLEPSLSERLDITSNKNSLGISKTRKILDIPTFSILTLSDKLLEAYAGWRATHKLNEDIRIEDTMFISCYISCSIAIAKNVAKIEKLMAS